MQFWELDQDHDFFISKDDLLRYGNHSLTYRIVDRIFAQVWRSTAVHTRAGSVSVLGLACAFRSL